MARFLRNVVVKKLDYGLESQGGKIIFALLDGVITNYMQLAIIYVRGPRLKSYKLIRKNYIFISDYIKSAPGDLSKFLYLGHK